MAGKVGLAHNQPRGNWPFVQLYLAFRLYVVLSSQLNLRIIPIQQIWLKAGLRAFFFFFFFFFFFYWEERYNCLPQLCILFQPVWCVISVSSHASRSKFTFIQIIYFSRPLKVVIHFLLAGKMLHTLRKIAHLQAYIKTLTAGSIWLEVRLYSF